MVRITDINIMNNKERVELIRELKEIASSNTSRYKSEIINLAEKALCNLLKDLS